MRWGRTTAISGRQRMPRSFVYWPKRGNGPPWNRARQRLSLRLGQESRPLDRETRRERLLPKLVPNSVARAEIRINRGDRQGRKAQKICHFLGLAGTWWDDRSRIRKPVPSPLSAGSLATANQGRLRALDSNR